MLTPQANTTVGPERQILLPPEFAFINAGRSGPKRTIEERLVDYYDTLEQSLDRFETCGRGPACRGAVIRRQRIDTADPGFNIIGLAESNADT